MAKITHYLCQRDNDAGGSPNTFTCTLELTDDGAISSSGSWRASGVNPMKIFVAERGTWSVAANIATLQAVGAEPVTMKNPSAAEGTLVGDGLVGGSVVTWRKT